MKKAVVMFYLEPITSTDFQALCRHLETTEDQVGQILCNDGESRQMVQVDEQRYRAVLADPATKVLFVFWIRLGGGPAMTDDESRSALLTSSRAMRNAKKAFREMIRRNGGKRAVKRHMREIGPIPGRRTVSRL